MSRLTKFGKIILIMTFFVIAMIASHFIPETPRDGPCKKETIDLIRYVS